MPEEQEQSLLEKMAENSIESVELNDEELEELAWMDYDGLLDMEVEFIADLGQTTLTIKEILSLRFNNFI